MKSAELYNAARHDALDRAIVRMEKNGFLIDTAFCSDAADRAMQQEADCLTGLRQWLWDVRISSERPDDIWASSKQLCELLHSSLGLPPSPVWKKGRVRVDKGERKTDETALGWIRERAPVRVRPGIDLLIRLRRLRGNIKYLTKLPTFIAPDGYVHPVSGPASDDDVRSGTITGRLACKNPEVMQIPVDPEKDWFGIRRAFVAPQGHCSIVADESALEVVILAHVLIKLLDDHQLAELLEKYGPSGLHNYNARRVFGDYLGWMVNGKKVSDYPLEAFSEIPELKKLRQDIKAVWYGLMYGKSAYGFATSLRDANNLPVGEGVAQGIMDGLLDSLPGVRSYQSWCLDYICEHHGIPGLDGRWCDLREYTTGDEWQVKRAHRIAQNFPMQDGGAAVIGHAMVEIDSDKELWDAGLRLERQVHDELDFRCPLVNDEPPAWIMKRIEKHMTSYPLTVPLQVKVGWGKNWADAK